MTGIATVTLYDTLGGDSSEYIIQQAELTTVVCTSDHINDLASIKESGNVPQLQNVIVMNDYTQDQVDRLTQCKVKCFTLGQLIEEGEEVKEQLHDPDKDDVFTICYTSGTTGNPKGVMLSHANIIALTAAIEKSPVKLGSKDVHLSYLPLAHIFERLMFFGVLSMGGSIGFYQGDVLKIVEDLAELRPTFFASVPRLFNRLYDKIQATLGELTGLKQKLANKGINAKLANLRKNGAVKH